MANAVPNTTLIIRQATTEMIRLVMWYLGFFNCALLANRVLNRNRQMMDQKVQQEEVDHHQGDRTPEFELVVVFHEEAAGLDKKALARLDPGPPLQGDQQGAQNHQNSNGDDGENPVLG